MKQKRGFTVIEVTLVLGIAGLILVMSFIAFPTLARSQRDAQRKSDIIKIADTIKKYQSNNNRGSLPKTQAELEKVIEDYGDSINKNDPYGTEYSHVYKSCGNDDCVPNLNDEYADGQIWFIVGASCGGDDGNTPIKIANPRKAALIYRLESGNDFFCYAI